MKSIRILVIALSCVALDLCGNAQTPTAFGLSAEKFAAVEEAIREASFFDAEVASIEAQIAKLIERRDEAAWRAASAAHPELSKELDTFRRGQADLRARSEQTLAQRRKDFLNGANYKQPPQAPASAK